MTANILQNLFGFSVMSALGTAGHQAGDLHQQIFQQSTASDIVVQSVITEFFCHFGKGFFQKKHIFQMNVSGKEASFLRNLFFQNIIPAKTGMRSRKNRCGQMGVFLIKIEVAAVKHRNFLIKKKTIGGACRQIDQGAGDKGIVLSFGFILSAAAAAVKETVVCRPEPALQETALFLMYKTNVGIDGLQVHGASAGVVWALS